MSNLNKHQMKAIEKISGKELVIAGAGTGKTFTIVEKVKRIIKCIDPSEVVVLTFTKKAASEMKKRILRETGNCTTGLFAGTFHSFCLMIIKKYAAFLPGCSGIPAVIKDQKRNEFYDKVVLQQICAFKGMPVIVIRHFIDNRRRLSKEIADILDNNGILQVIDGILEQYRLFKSTQNLIDYDDMITIVIDMIANNRELRTMLYRKYRYFIIDEYQDCSQKNIKLIQVLLNPSDQNLFLVGDDWQSIYGFRNADVQYIIKATKWFPGIQVHRLGVNYRSKKEILSVSNRIIKHNRRQVRKKLTSFKGKGGSVVYYFINCHYDGINLLKEIVKSELKVLQSIAILYRNNDYGKLIQHFYPEIKTFSNISLSTIHASKGLEYSTVIIVGISDLIMPGRLSDIEEERRLFYVAMTRAREKLYLFFVHEKGHEIPRFAKEIGLKK